MTTIVYTVEPGDTLWGIAQHFGTTVNDIARYNGLAFPDKIYPGVQRTRPGPESARTGYGFADCGGDSPA